MDPVDSAAAASEAARAASDTLLASGRIDNSYRQSPAMARGQAGPRRSRKTIFLITLLERTNFLLSRGSDSSVHSQWPTSLATIAALAAMAATR
jgi:hypothetical protein